LRRGYKTGKAVVQNAFQAAWDESAIGMRAAGFSDEQIVERIREAMLE
jgi:hypothetical protein